jgi:hypothetical protein
LLVLVTSCPRAPVGGFGAISLSIYRDEVPSHITKSHTCSAVLMLPDDPDEERLYRKLTIALENAEGFGFK